MVHEPRAVALRAEPVTALRREGRSARALPVIEVSAEPVSPPAQILSPMSAAAVSERLIAAVLERMQKELREHEARFAGAGVTSSAKARVSDAMEWAMLGVAYGVEAKTNQAAMASIFKTAGASWLYGLGGARADRRAGVLKPDKIGEGSSTRLDGMLGAGDGHDHRFGQGLSRWRAGMVSQRRCGARARKGAGGGEAGSRRR